MNTPAGWKIDDVAYDAGFPFGNTGTLSDTLKMAIAVNHSSNRQVTYLPRLPRIVPERKSPMT